MTAVRRDLTAVRLDLTAVRLDLAAVRLDLTAIRRDLTAVRLDLTATRRYLTAVGRDLGFCFLRSDVTIRVSGIVRAIGIRRPSVRSIGWVPPAFAASNRRPAVRRAGIEIRNGWRRGVVSLGGIGSVRVRGPRRVLLRVAEIVVHPLLMLSGLRPRQVARKGGLSEPIVCVGGLNETLRSSEDMVSQDR